MSLFHIKSYGITYISSPRWYFDIYGYLILKCMNAVMSAKQNQEMIERKLAENDLRDFR